MNPDSIRRLYDYSYWASEKVWDCIMPLTDEQFVQDTGYSSGSIRNHVVHMMSAERRWMQRVRGETVSPNLLFDDYPGCKTTKVKWDAVKVEVLDYIYSLDQEQLDEIVHSEIQSRELHFSLRRWELLLHVANHATDHRAQILTLLNRHFGIETVEQDMLFYLIEQS